MKSFNVVECKFIDEKLRGDYGDYFPFINKLIVGVKILINWFSLAPKHKDEIQVKVAQYNSFEHVCILFVFIMESDNLNEIAT